MGPTDYPRPEGTRAPKPGTGAVYLRRRRTMDRRDEDKADPAAEAPKRPARERPPLLTSADIFGDVLEDLGEQRPPDPGPPPPSAAPARSGPIKVQVGEPGGPRGDVTAAEPLADDLKALLDAFDEPPPPLVAPATLAASAAEAVVEDEETPAPTEPEPADVPLAIEAAPEEPEPVPQVL